MNRLENKNKIAIVVVGYNRLNSIKRLLDSLLDAQYPSNDIPLVISIDCSGCTELYDYVRQFEWPYGEKYVIIQEIRLGLKEHIFRCGDLTEYFKAIILLEDDLFVSPYFYDYVLQAVDVYGEEERIAEISLYKNERNGYVGLPFSNLQNGADVFLMQDVGTWGECWTKQMWDGFKVWYINKCTEEVVEETDMPQSIKRWTKAWSKYYNAYVVNNKKYVLYPNVAVSTNFNDAGEHVNISSNVVQVSLQMQSFKYRMPKMEELVRYDIYFNNEDVYKWLSLGKEDVALDIYGFHEEKGTRRYLLSTKILPFSVIKSYGLSLRPLELNIRYDVSGMGIFLYDTHISLSRKKRGYNEGMAFYFLRDFNGSLLLHYVKKREKENVKNFFKKIIKKFRKCFS